MAKAKPGERTQREMVEEFLNSGVEKPSEIVEAVKGKFGVAIKPANVNQIKVAWKKRKNSPISLRKTRKKSTAVTAAGNSTAGDTTVAATPAAKPAVGGKISELEVAKFALKLGGVNEAISALKKLLD